MTLKSILLALALSISSVTAVMAVPSPTFTLSGGNGTALTITVNTAFTLTASAFLDSGEGTIFLAFEGLNAPTSDYFSLLNTPFAFTKDGTPDNNGSVIQTTSNNYNGKLTPGNIYFSIENNLNVGEVFIFAGGQTFTTNSTWASDPATFSTDFQLALVSDVSENYMSNVVNASIVGSSVPEPSTYALFAGAAMLGYVVYRRKGKAVPKAL